MPSSHDETADDSTPPDVPGQPQGSRPDGAGGDDDARTHGTDDVAPGTPAAPGAGSTEGAGRAADDLDPLTADAEFLRLVSELDDVPGFRDLQPPAGPRRPATGRAAGPRDWPTTPEVERLEDEESHFVPPDPGLDLSGDPWRVLGWALVVLGAAGVLVGVVLSSLVPRVVTGSAGGALLLGVIVLLWRMPHDRPHDDTGSDDGAVV